MKVLNSKVKLRYIDINILLKRLNQHIDIDEIENIE